MHNTAYLEIFADHLLPGDILLYRPKRPGLVQRKISKITQSPYTHAAIYIGNGTIAESVAFPFLRGVRTAPVKTLYKGANYIAVLRSQLGFSGDRPRVLTEFIEKLIQENKFYNLKAVLFFNKRSTYYFDNQLDFIKENYDKSLSRDEFSKHSFFCSALVVACYTVTGLIGDKAQSGYPPDYFSPKGLYQDPTFGWLLGYICLENNTIPDDDPALSEATNWKDCLDIKWW